MSSLFMEVQKGSKENELVVEIPGHSLLRAVLMDR